MLLIIELTMISVVRLMSEDDDINPENEKNLGIFSKVF
jgi:hypothetical protein